MLPPLALDAVALADVVIVNIDGACIPVNPGGTATGGYVIAPHRHVPALLNGWTGHAVYCSGPGATNNVAEYRAAIDALNAVARTGWRGPVVVLSDSQLLVNQFNGRWSCNAENLRPLLARLHRGAPFFDALTLVWVCREQNTAADALSHRAYVEHVQARRVSA